MEKKVITLIALLSTVGCSTVAESLKSTTYYKRDIKFTINGVKTSGAVVVPWSPSYNIVGESRGGDFDYLLINSCHRQAAMEKEGSEFKYTYTPVHGIEDNRACPVVVTAAEKTKGRSSYGFIDFEDGRHSLPAQLLCSGVIKNMAGVSVCQAPTGLVESISFPVEAYVASGSADCVMSESKDLRTYEYKMPAKQCTFIFQEKAEPHRMHRLTTLGYSEIVIREL